MQIYLRQDASAVPGAQATTWVAGPTIQHPESPTNEWFGRDVDLHDGAMIVSAPRRQDYAGIVAVYEENAGVWTTEGFLSGVDSAGCSNGPGDLLGWSVAISGDRAIAGAPGHVLRNSACTPTGAQAGAAYTFVRTSLGWRPETKLIASDPQDGARFGESVDIDGNLAIVGAPNHESQKGAVYIFEFDEATGAWNQVAQDVATGLELQINLGATVGLDGERAVAGAPNADKATTFGGTLVPDAGVVRTYFGPSFAQLGGAPIGGSWHRWSDLSHPNPAASDGFGSSLDVQERKLLVGTPRRGDNGPVSGTVTPYFIPEGANKWNKGGKLVAYDAAPYWSFGKDVALDVRGGERAWLVGSSNGVYFHTSYDLELSADVPLVSVASGGTVTYTIDSSPAFAGSVYVVFGSLSGTQPGFSVDNVLLPVNFDPFTQYLLGAPNSPPYTGAIGVLDSNGDANFSLSVPPGSLGQAWVGARLDHCAALITAAPLPIVAFATGSYSTDFIP